MGRLTSRRFTAVTVTVAALLAAEALGLLNGVNSLVYSSLPSATSSSLLILTETASLYATLAYAAALYIWDRWKERDTSLSVGFLTALVAGMLAVAALKWLTGVPRPHPDTVAFSAAILAPIESLDYYAFPSGHSTRAAMIAYYIGERAPRFKGLLWAYAVIIAVSRLLLQVHWFSDVVFGLVFGYWVSELTRALMEKGS